jgi:iron complex outermembrane receptor protein
MLLTTFLLIFGAATEAQQGPKDLTESSLEDLANIQVYSASKHLENENEAPSSVSVITADEIQKYGYRTLADILRSVRGFDITYDRNYSYAGVRGINRPADYNSRILLLIDGQRINNNIYEQAMLGTEFPLDIDLIDRVEIIRGPSSSLYGASAFFAVINVLTRKPQQLTGWELSFEPASFETYRERISYGGSFRGVSALLSGGFFNTRGQSLFYPEFNAPATNDGISQNADYDRYQHFLATISFRGFTVQGLFNDRTKGIPTGSFGTLFDDRRTHSLDGQRNVTLSYRHSLGEHWDLAARSAVNRYVYDAIFVYGPSTPGGSDVLNDDFARGTWWSGEADLHRAWVKHDVTLGTEFQDNLQQDQVNYDINPFVPYIGSRPPSSRNYALYAQDEFTINRQFTLSAGVRYDRYYSFGGTTNPRLGLIYRPLTNSTFKFLYGTAFRAPSAYETFYYGLGQYQADLDLQPETIRSYEAIVEQRLGQHFRLSGGGFRNEISHVIAQVTNSSGFLVFQNTGSENANGLQTELDGNFAGGLKGRASYSYTRLSDLAKGEVGTNSPEHMAKLNLIIPFIPQRLFAGLEGQYNGPRPTIQGTMASSFQVFNATLLGHAFGKHLDISGSVYNLLDKRYFDPTPPGLVQDQIQQDGRSFRAKITVRF